MGGLVVGWDLRVQLKEHLLDLSIEPVRRSRRGEPTRVGGDLGVSGRCRMGLEAAARFRLLER